MSKRLRQDDLGSVNDLLDKSVLGTVLGEAFGPSASKFVYGLYHGDSITRIREKVIPAKQVTAEVLVGAESLGDGVQHTVDIISKRLAHEVSKALEHEQFGDGMQDINVKAKVTFPERKANLLVRPGAPVEEMEKGNGRTYPPDMFREYIKQLKGASGPDRVLAEEFLQKDFPCDTEAEEKLIKACADEIRRRILDKEHV